MTASNDKKQAKLGMPYGTANGKLKKNMMFYMAIQLKMDRCFHCKQLIMSVNDFSIEHKESWLNSENPVENFFDLNNIAFSHLKCNIEASDKTNKIYSSIKQQKKAGSARYYSRNKDIINERKRIKRSLSLTG